jgi:colanic acid/amylovoran biosynthesis glycosyltransferase
MARTFNQLCNGLRKDHDNDLAHLLPQRLQLMCCQKTKVKITRLMQILPTKDVLDSDPRASANTEKPRIAYLLSQYPAVSHTFFLKEILGLKQLGFHIETSSVNRPDRPVSELTPIEAREASQTYYIKDTSHWRILTTLMLVLVKHPGIFWRGLRTALRLDPWDLYRSFYALLYLTEALLLGEWMKRRNLSHLHVHFGGSVATVAFLTCAAWGFSYSLTIHGPEEFYDVEHFHLAQKFNRARLIFCISDFCRSQVMKYCDPSQWDKLRVIRLGVDLDEFVPAPVSNRRNTGLHIVSVGRLVPAKGQTILLRSVSLLLRWGCSIHLTLVGDGTSREVLKKFVEDHQISQHVTFQGALNHDQTHQQLAEADIFALASFAEGVPVALMEAMAMEIPCVSTQIAGIPELIRHNVDGLLVPPSSDEALAAALELLIKDEGLRRKLGASGRARVMDRYNLPQNLKLLGAAFEEALSNQPGCAAN